MLKKINILLMSVFLVIASSPTVFGASSPEVTYFGGSKWDQFEAFDQTSDGGYIAAGCTSSEDGDLQGINKGMDDALLVKYDAGGNLEWVKTFGGKSIDSFYNVKQTRDGGYIAVGSSSSIDGDMSNSNKKKRGDSSGNSQDAIIVKYDSKGNMEWFNDLGGSKLDRYNSVVETKEGYYFVVGYSSSCDGDMVYQPGEPRGYGDPVYAVYDNFGRFRWERTIGGSGEDGFNSVVSCSDGSLVAAGYTSSRDGFLNGTGNSLLKGYIVKINLDQSIPWVKTVDFLDLTDKSITYLSGTGFQDIKNTDDNGFIAVGRGMYKTPIAGGGSYNNDNAKIIKYDSNGNIEWQETYMNEDYTVFNAVVQGQDSSYTAIGITYGRDVPIRQIVVNYSKDGKVQWVKDGAANEKYHTEFKCLQVKDNKFVTTGTKFTLDKGDQGVLYVGNFQELTQVYPTAKSVNDNDFVLLKQLDNVELDKNWTINLKDSVDEKSLDNSTIFILDESNQRVAINTSLNPNNNKQIIVKPINSYQSGKTYRLYITKDIKSTKHQNLARALLIKFTVK